MFEMFIINYTKTCLEQNYSDCRLAETLIG